MGLRERVSWASLIANGLIIIAYFIPFAVDWRSRIASPDAGVGHVLGAFGLLVGVSALGATIAIVKSRRDEIAPYDERERLIRLHASNVTAAVIMAGVLAVVVALFLGLNGVLAANLLLAVIVVSEVVKASSHIIQFRRGA